MTPARAAWGPGVLIMVIGVACAHRGPAGHEHTIAARLPAETLAGDPIEIGGPGPVRLVEVWATWCAPCVPAAKSARTVLSRHPGVLSYAVAVDSDRDAVERHVAASPAAGEPLLYRGGAPAAARRGFDQLPTFVALDTRGRIAGSVTGAGPGLAPALDRLLRQAEGRIGQRD